MLRRARQARATLLRHVQKGLEGFLGVMEQPFHRGAGEQRVRRTGSSPRPNAQRTTAAFRLSDTIRLRHAAEERKGLHVEAEPRL